MDQRKTGVNIPHWEASWFIRSREIVDALIGAKRHVTYLDIDAPHGHDAFLVPIPRYLAAFGAYMQRVARELGAG